MANDRGEMQQKGRTEKRAEVEGEKWVMHYSSKHEILLVGEGDFSFSLCLAATFGSASNIVATSLDSDVEVITKYKQGKSNLENLKKLGAILLHQVDATKMNLPMNLKMRRFDRIIYNFPHVGFHGKEDDPRQIKENQNLVESFLIKARWMLKDDGQIHVAHKASRASRSWNIEELGRKNSLEVDHVPFNMKDYPGYSNKRGDGAYCDRPFPMGKSYTYKFIVTPSAKRTHQAQNQPGFRPKRSREFEMSFPVKKLRQQPPSSCEQLQKMVNMNMTQINGHAQPNAFTNITPINDFVLSHLHLRASYEIKSLQTSLYQGHSPTMSYMNQFNVGAFWPLGTHVSDGQCNDASRKHEYTYINPETSSVQKWKHGSGRSIAEARERCLRRKIMVRRYGQDPKAAGHAGIKFQ